MIQSVSKESPLHTEYSNIVAESAGKLDESLSKACFTPIKGVNPFGLNLEKLTEQREEQSLTEKLDCLDSVMNDLKRLYEVLQLDSDVSGLN